MLGSPEACAVARRLEDLKAAYARWKGLSDHGQARVLAAAWEGLVRLCEDNIPVAPQVIASVLMEAVEAEAAFPLVPDFEESGEVLGARRH